MTTILTGLKDTKLRMIAKEIETTNKIDEADVSRLIKSANDGKGISASERHDLEKLLAHIPAEAWKGDAFNTLEDYLGKLPSLTTKAADVSELKDLVSAFKAEFFDRMTELSKIPTRALAFLTDYVGQAQKLSTRAEPELAKEIMKNLEAEAERLSLLRQFSKTDRDRDLRTDLDEVLAGRDVTAYENSSVETDSTWKTTYWPMAGSGGIQDGNPSTNLWAIGGCLDKFDTILEARGLEKGALKYERQPSLNSLIGKTSEKGHWVADDTPSEDNAEWTTGVDFNGDGKITKGVRVDFLNQHKRMVGVQNINQYRVVADIDGKETIINKRIEEKDGEKTIIYSKEDGSALTEAELNTVRYLNPNSDKKISESIDTGWWGSCDKVTLGGLLFRAPIKDEVEFEGVKFNKQDMLGLLTVIAQSQSTGTEYFGHRYNKEPDVVYLKNGRQIKGNVILEKDGRPVSLTFQIRKSEGFMRTHGDNVYVSDPSAEEFGEVIKVGQRGVAEPVEIPINEVAHILTEERDDMNPVELMNTLFKWLDEGKPIAKDSDTGVQVWNSTLSSAQISSMKKLDRSDIKYLNPGHKGLANPENEIYSYYSSADNFWVEFKDDKVVNAGWNGSNGGNYDFIWRPTGFKDFSGDNPRNPFVKPEIVKEIYDMFMEDDSAPAG